MLHNCSAKRDLFGRNIAINTKDHNTVCPGLGKSSRISGVDIRCHRHRRTITALHQIQQRCVLALGHHKRQVGQMFRTALGHTVRKLGQPRLTAQCNAFNL